MKDMVIFRPIALLAGVVSAQQTIHVEMGGGGGIGDILGAMMGGGGGMMMGGQRGPRKLSWPSGVSEKIDSAFDWIVNTEWKGKSGNLIFNRDGELAGTVKACKQEGICKWSASKGLININTPDTQKTSDQVLRFYVRGTDAYPGKDGSSVGKEEKKAAKSRLDMHDSKELEKTYLEGSKPTARTGQPPVLTFVKILSSGEEDSLLAEDAFAILGVDEDATASDIKKNYRKLSVKNHPDKGGDPVYFDKIRQSYEMLSDDEKRQQYLIGGALLVKNIETHHKEMEGMVAQQMAQLDQQVPKGHPMRAQAEAQINAQTMSKSQMKGEIEKRLRQEETEVEVPLTLEELLQGIAEKTFDFKRLAICRGCRADPSSESCKSCGRCPPEVRQIPKMQGPFMVGSKEVEVESRERCKETPVILKGIRVPANASDKSALKKFKNAGHQTPGRLPGTVKLVVKRLPHATYESHADDLFTTLTISLEEALYGFEKTWNALDDRNSPVTVSRNGKVTKPDEVIRIADRGMYKPTGAGRGSLFVRIIVDFPNKPPTKYSLNSPPKEEAQLEKEDRLTVHDGVLFKEWSKLTTKKKKGSKKSAKEEL